MTDTWLALWTLGVVAIGFTMGWAARDRKLSERKAKLDDLFMMLRPAVEAEWVTIARKVGAL